MPTPLDHTSPDPRIQRAADAIRVGNAIEAIKHLRDATGMTLKEAKETVEQLMAEQGTPPMAAAGEDIEAILTRAPASPAEPLPDPLETRVRALVAQKKYIDAVKLVREVTGADPKTARARVEQMAGESTSNKGKAFMALVVGLLVILMAVLMLVLGD